MVFVGKQGRGRWTMRCERRSDVQYMQRRPERPRWQPQARRGTCLFLDRGISRRATICRQCTFDGKRSVSRKGCSRYGISTYGRCPRHLLQRLWKSVGVLGLGAGNSEALMRELLAFDSNHHRNVARRVLHEVRSGGLVKSTLTKVPS